MYIIYGFPDCHFHIFKLFLHGKFLRQKNLLELEVTEIIFQQYLSYIMIVGLIGGWNTNTQRKPPIWC
jgi:hypothetical protein